MCWPLNSRIVPPVLISHYPFLKTYWTSLPKTFNELIIINSWLTRSKDTTPAKVRTWLSGSLESTTTLLWAGSPTCLKPALKASAALHVSKITSPIFVSRLKMIFGSSDPFKSLPVAAPRTLSGMLRLRILSWSLKRINWTHTIFYCHLKIWESWRKNESTHINLMGDAIDFKYL